MPSCTPDCWTPATCTTCGRHKALSGRSIPPALYGAYCDALCPGHFDDPQAPHLTSEHDSDRAYFDEEWAAANGYEAEPEPCRCRPGRLQPCAACMTRINEGGREVGGDLPAWTARNALEAAGVGQLEQQLAAAEAFLTNRDNHEDWCRVQAHRDCCETQMWDCNCNLSDLRAVLADKEATDG
jgi:hypothetical protein